LKPLKKKFKKVKTITPKRGNISKYKIENILKFNEESKEKQFFTSKKKSS
jgi:hypothetical protein